MMKTYVFVFTLNAVYHYKYFSTVFRVKQILEVKIQFVWVCVCVCVLVQY